MHYASAGVGVRRADRAVRSGGKLLRSAISVRPTRAPTFDQCRTLHMGRVITDSFRLLMLPRIRVSSKMAMSTAIIILLAYVHRSSNLDRKIYLCASENISLYVLVHLHVSCFPHLRYRIYHITRPTSCVEASSPCRPRCHISGNWVTGRDLSLQ